MQDSKTQGLGKNGWKEKDVNSKIGRSKINGRNRKDQSSEGSAIFSLPVNFT